MKKILVLVLGLSLIVSCSDDDGDDNNTIPPVVDSFDYNENLSGDLSNDHSTPTSLSFIVGRNIVTASQSSSDVDYLTFVVPDGAVLSQILVDDYQSSDNIAFMGITNGASFATDIASTQNRADLLGGTTYGTASVGNDVLSLMGSLNGAQGFTGALPAGAYTIWLNQTGLESTATLNFVILQQ